MPTYNMRTITAPPDFPLGQRACVRKDAVNFVKLNEDGFIKFIAQCNERDRNCQVWGYFHDWPVLLWAPHAQRHDWYGAFDRVNISDAIQGTEDCKKLVTEVIQSERKVLRSLGLGKR